MGYTPLSVIVAAVSANTQSTQSTLMNNTGITLPALTPVRVNGDGEMETIDVSVDTSALSVVGVTSEDVSNGVSGIIVTHGRVLDITTSFAVGDYVYVSSTGDMTNILPEVGSDGFVASDFIIRLGVVAKNETDSNKKDLFVGISIVGQL